MSKVPTRAFVGLFVAAAAACFAPPAAAVETRVHLELGGELAPANIQVLSRDGAQYIPALALLLVGWGVEWTAENHSAVAVMNGGVKAQFSADATEAKVTAGGPTVPTTEPLKQPPVYRNGCLYLPVSALEQVLKIAVEWDAPHSTLRVGTPAPAPEQLRRWCEVLRVADTSIFHRSQFRVKLSVPDGTTIPEDQEFPLNVRTNADGCVQIYLRNGAAALHPLWGVDPDGALVRDPDSEGRPERAPTCKAWQTLRWRLMTTPGNFWVVAIATNAAKPPQALLAALTGGSPPVGDWAVDALEITVVPRPRK